MGVQLVQSTYNTVDGRNPANHLGRKKTKSVVNNGMNYQPQVMQAGFLNYQQYHLLFGLFSIGFLRIFIHPWLAPLEVANLRLPREKSTVCWNNFEPWTGSALLKPCVWGLVP